MKRVFKIISVLAILAIAVAVAGVAVLSSLDFNEYKGVISEEAKKATGRDVVIAGDLKLDISLTPSLYVDGVTVSNASWGSRKEMVKLGRLEAEVALLPLLSNEIDVKRLVLVGLDLILETDKSGQGNWEFGAPTTDAPANAGSDKSQGLLPVVRKVQIKDLKVTYKDGQTGKSTQLTLPKLDLSASSVSAPLIFSMTGDVNGETFSGDGTLASVAQLTSGKDIPIDVKFSALDADLAVKGTIADAKKLAGLAVTIKATGDSLAGTVAKAKKLAPQLASVQVPDLGPFDVGLTVTGSAEKPALANLKIKIGRADSAEFQALGGISNPLGPSGIDLQVVAKVKQPTEFAKSAGVEIPPLPPLFAATRISDVKGGYKLADLDIKLGKSDIKGVAVARLGGVRPQVSADLTSQTLDLDELLPKQDSASTTGEPVAAPAAGDGRVFPADPLPLDGLKAADADLKLQAGMVRVNGVDVTDLKFVLRLAGGNLALKPFEATVSEGKISGDVSLGGGEATPPVRLNLAIDKIDYGKLLAAMGQEVIAKGKLDVRLRAAGAGSSVRAIMAGLDGKLRLVSEKGKIESNLLNVASADVLSALPMVDSKGDKDLRCAVIDMDIAKGLAASKAIVLETGGLSVVGVGGINLKDETLNLVFEPRAKKTSLLSAALVPVAVRGTIAKPDPQINPGDLVSGVVGNVASGAAAVMTLGLSTLAQSAFTRATNTDETDYCKLALAGQAVTPSKGKEKSSSSGETGKSGSQPPAQEESNPAGAVGNALEGVTKGIGGGLKNLFGN